MSADKIMKIKKKNIQVSSSGKKIITTRKNNGVEALINYIYDTKNLNNEKTINDKTILDNTEKTYDGLINYVSNTNKCYNEESGKFLIDSLNCDNTLDAISEFNSCEKNYHAHKVESCSSKAIPNEAFHIIQSFKGKDLPADKVHELGMELARRLCGESFKAVVTTHTNTDNYHNHIAICAYACDGFYKFKDSWNLGLKLQRLSNELSLENGIPIITEIPKENYELEDEEITNIFEDKDTSKNHYTNIGEYKMYQEGKLDKAQLQSDIELTAQSCSNFDDYKKQMELKGYKLIEQAKSIKYVKIPTSWKNDNLSHFQLVGKNKKELNAIRDTRLGKKYTRQSLEQYFRNKSNEQIIEEALNSYKIKINIAKLIPRKFEGKKGNIERIPLLFRLFEFLIKLLEAILTASDTYHSKESSTKKIVRERTNELKKQAEKLNKAIVKASIIAKKHGIQNLNSLQIKKKETLRLYFQHLNQNKNKVDAFRIYKKIEESYNKILELEDFIKSKSLTDKDLLIEPQGEANILENKAKIDPPSSQTKSRLYKAMYNSGYKLKYKFNQLTEKDCKEICYFLAEINKGNKKAKKPETLYTIKEYMTLKKQNKLYEASYTPHEANLHTPNLSSYTEEEKALIKQYRKAKLTLSSFGLSSIDDTKAYIDETITPQREIYTNLEKVLSEEKETLSELNIIEELLTGKLSEKYKPIKLLDDTEKIEKEISKFILENESIKEQLITIKTLIDDPYIKSAIDLLDNDLTIVAPSEVLSLVKTILACEGKDIELKDLLKYTKKELKQIIDDFIKTYDIDKILQTELDSEMNIEKERLKTLQEENEDIKLEKDDQELIEQTTKEQQEAINKIIKGFTKK